MGQCLSVFDDPDPRSPHFDEGQAHLARYEETGSVTNLTRAIEALRDGMPQPHTPRVHPNAAARYNPKPDAHLRPWLCVLGYERAEITGDLADLDEAVNCHSVVVRNTWKDDPKAPGLLSNLGLSLLARFKRTGSIENLTEAILWNREALRLTQGGDPDLPIRLLNLGASFHARFERTGDLVDISEAIAYSQKAVTLSPEGGTSLPEVLADLGSAFQSRFKRTGDIEDLTEAISCFERALEMAPKDHEYLPAYTSNLGAAFHYRFQDTRHLTDINESISHFRKATQMTPEGHAMLPGRLSNLGMALHSRFELTDNDVDLAEALLCQRRAVDLTPNDHANLPTWLSGLGTFLKSRFERSGNIEDLVEAVSCACRAMQLVPERHATFPVFLYHLSTLLYDFYCHDNDSEKLEACISHLKVAAIGNVGHPRTRLSAAALWARLRHRHFPQSADTLTAFDYAIRLLTSTAGLEQTIQLRYTQLQDFSELPLEAASAACALGRPMRALEWLEKGRCLVWGQLTNLRTPVDTLILAKHSELAQRITEVAAQLEPAGLARAQPHVGIPLMERITAENENRAHLDLAKEWEGLLTEARAISGLETFMMPTPCSTILQHLPESGYVVVINVSKDRCDALVLRSGHNILHIPLDSFSEEKAQRYRNGLSDTLKSHQLRDRASNIIADLDEEVGERAVRPVLRRGRGGNPVHDILRGLWVEVVKPILETLELLKVSQGAESTLPRIWWCPTGPLSFLPLHAAGIYGRGVSETVLDYAVSSYTPTVSALTSRLKGPALTVGNEKSGLCLISQVIAPGANPIPGTSREVQSVHTLVSGTNVRVLKHEGKAVSVKKCLKNMKNYTSIHLACHASQNANEPLQSRFLFHNGALDLGTIIRENLKNADLAFLSACETSAGDEKLSNEAVHLAAGMLAAGYRRVVATMWSIGDRNAPEVAVDFYRYLLKDGDARGRFDGSNSAHALHHAMQALRRRLGESEESLFAWVPYVHFGY
ncbi:hypothetical protein D9611_013426 [Ephemerocybe angulata]|uniref:CHAT domain-containing protein n=1 Tax=Ephemerocybe angulata TaxID=980116 RepID=A0A8H5BWK6_9AGAR|nr:hypothetical protein D9611_013426 [Tulosesus angulatus]